MPNLCPFKFVQLGRGQIVALHEHRLNVADMDSITCSGEDCMLFIGTSKGPDGRLLGICGITHGAVQTTYAVDFLRSLFNRLGAVSAIGLKGLRLALAALPGSELHDDIDRLITQLSPAGTPPPPRGTESMPSTGEPLPTLKS